MPSDITDENGKPITKRRVAMCRPA